MTKLKTRIMEAIKAALGSVVAVVVILLGIALVVGNLMAFTWVVQQVSHWGSGGVFHFVAGLGLMAAGILNISAYIVAFEYLGDWLNPEK